MRSLDEQLEVGKGVPAGDLRNFLSGVGVPEYFVNVDLVYFLQNGQFAVVGREQRAEAGQLVEQLRLVAEVVNAVCVEDHHRVVRQVSN